MTSLFGVHAKAITALIGQGLTLAAFYWGGSNHWVELAIGIAAAVGVYAVPNTVPPSAPPPEVHEPAQPAAG